MRLLRSIEDLDRLARGKGRVLTIGAFDGLHLGHREILSRAATVAADRGEDLAVMCFEPTPAEFFSRGEPPERLTCFRERFELLRSAGVDELICLRFAEVNSLRHTEFIEDIVIRRLGAGHIVVGHDFRYGHGRKGTLGTLSSALKSASCGLTVVDPVVAAGDRVSSTRIREALVEGRLDAARSMLGRDYSMSGRVVHGLGLGKDLGFPTANVNLKRRRAPVDGIFAVQVDGIGGRKAIDGVASVGSRPTVGGGKTLLEVYLFDFGSEIYGEYITVRFRRRLRSEEHFSSIDEMKTQMHADVEAAKAALAERIA